MGFLRIWQNRSVINWGYVLRSILLLWWTCLDFLVVVWKRLDKLYHQYRQHGWPYRNMVSLYSATKFAAIGFPTPCAWNSYLLVFMLRRLIWAYQNSLFRSSRSDGSYVKLSISIFLRPDFVAGKIVNVLAKKSEINLPWILNLARRFYTCFRMKADKLAVKMFNYK